ncbi:F-box protein At5g49610 isoform X2 [Telopea speciosissima]|nr:F-box protein At5g49610 isoform X2 [Telopea speciosissima]
MVLVEVIKSFYTKSTFICVDRLMGVSEFSLDFLKDRVKVRASCNGLLCCSSIPNKGVYYVCNPMTREFKLLPRTRERPMTRFHPDDEATLVGLAFNLSTLKFNVVLAGFYRPFGRRPLDSFICLVFDSETNTWRRSVSSRSDEFTHMNKNQVVFVSGSLHWLTSSCLYILVLDLDNDVWRKIPLPAEVIGKGETGSGSRVHLLELGGSLSVIQISEAWMSIWVLKNYEREEWCMVDKVSLRCIKGLVASVFPISQTEEFMLMATQRQILLYHRNNRVWKEMYSVKNAYTYPLWFSAHAFQSTLFSCHQGEE